MKKQYAMIDIFKFLSAIIIVAIHTRPFEHYTDSILFRPYTFLKCFSIAFFFVSSSFLFFKKIDLNDLQSQNNLKYLKKWSIRLTKVYLFYTLINIGLMFLAGDDIGAINWFRFLIVGSGNGYLWFLVTLIFSILIIYLFLCLFSGILGKSNPLIIAVILLLTITFVMMCVLQFYSNWFEATPLSKLIEIYYRNFDDVRNIISGTFYSTLGLLVVIFEKYYQSMKNKILCFSWGIVSYMEMNFVINNSMWHEEYCNGLIGVFLFFILLECSQCNISLSLAKYLRKASNVLYLQQRYLIILFSILSRYIEIWDNNIYVFLGVVCILCFMTKIYSLLEKTRINVFLRYMY